jgi:hypothetical protein
MQKLRELIASHNRWSAFDIFIERIELSRDHDFSQAFENAKALLESVCKEICQSCGVQLAAQSSMNGIVKSSFSALGFTNTSHTVKISGALATIGQTVGELRNDTGVTGHGRTAEELRRRNSQFDELTKDFLLDSVRTIVIFLIRTFEQQHSMQQPAISQEVEREPDYTDCENFNDFWDDTYGEFAMGEYSYPASVILYHVDSEAYHYVRKNFEAEENSREQS